MLWSAAYIASFLPLELNDDAWDTCNLTVPPKGELKNELNIVVKSVLSVSKISGYIYVRKIRLKANSANIHIVFQFLKTIS